MFMQRILFRIRKVKAGISTVLGMLIFIGVLFTCVIPLFLYINEVNNMYDRTVIEMKQFDEDRESEIIDVYAYPLGESDTRICLYIKNKCPLPVTVKRVWINNYAFDLSFNISSMQFNTTSPIDVSVLLPSEGTKDFRIKVTTTRGNIFASLTNPLEYTAENGGSWTGGVGFSINIVLTGTLWGHYNFKVSNASDPGQVFYSITEMMWWLSEQSYFKRVNLPGPGTYNVTISYLDYSKNEIKRLTLDDPSEWVFMNYPEDFHKDSE